MLRNEQISMGCVTEVPLTRIASPLELVGTGDVDRAFSHNGPALISAVAGALRISLDGLDKVEA